MTIILFILTAILSSITTLIAPVLVARIRRYITRKIPRERNMRTKIRKEVDLYLNELRND
jgi:hypothetical protein